MKTLLPLAWASAWNRRLSLTLAALSIALAVALLLSVTRAREAAQTHFAQSVAGVDLVVGPRGSPVQLLLHAVFHLGDASHTLAWKSYQALAADPLIAWRLPLALGDSHQGFPVLGSTPEYFRHLGDGQQQGLRFADGRPFAGLFEAVIGAEVAARLGYRTGQQITLQHGASHLDAHHHDEDANHPEHADKPFRIVGVLAPTGTPVDRTLVVSLQALEAIHLDWQGGMPMPGLSIPAEAAGKFDLTPKHLNAVLIGLHQRTDVFRVQRQINAFGGEPLMAILPGLAMDELWQLVGSVERTLHGLAWLVMAAGLAGLVAVIVASLGERRRELAILRSVGAGRRRLLVLEGALVTVAGIALGMVVVEAAGHLLAPWLRTRLGMDLSGATLSIEALQRVGAVLATGIAASLIPAWRASRMALADGLLPRL
ncbi:MAG TPA: ABC transporter permease [Zoogloea sp.]|nr:ABC transporter permease [Zoogloea sp.]